MGEIPTFSFSPEEEARVLRFLSGPEETLQDTESRDPKVSAVVGERIVIVDGKRYKARDAGHASLFNSHIAQAEKDRRNDNG